LADTRDMRWVWQREVPWRARVAFEAVGFVVLGVVYAVTNSSRLQCVVLIAYPLCVGVLMLWRFRGTRPMIDSAVLSKQAKLQSLAFLVVWGVIVVLALEPVSREVVGPWFAWWLVIVPSMEFDRLLKWYSSERRSHTRGLSR
jgi:hypothetical protein